jgi:hypothetical protein
MNTTDAGKCPWCGRTCHMDEQPSTKYPGYTEYVCSNCRCVGYAKVRHGPVRTEQEAHIA